jgi:hypothetical protein
MKVNCKHTTVYIKHNIKVILMWADWYLKNTLTWHCRPRNFRIFKSQKYRRSIYLLGDTNTTSLPATTVEVLVSQHILICPQQDNIVASRLKAQISESEWAPIIRQRLSIRGSILSGWQWKRFTRQRIHNRCYHGNENHNSCSSCGNEYTSYWCIEHVKRKPWRRCLLGCPTVEYNRPNRTERMEKNRAEFRTERTECRTEETSGSKN